MYDINTKLNIKCPVCGSSAELFQHTYYICPKCNWDSLVNTVDIAYGDPASSVLSNLFPHKFLFYTKTRPGIFDDTHCLSMESFLQSLRVKEASFQKYICENYSGPMVQKLKVCLRDWREDGYLYWNGIAINRDSLTYHELITTAYDCLFESNPIFRECVLPKFKGVHLIHSIGKDYESETLLTESEFRYQLNRLIQRLDYNQSQSSE
ncbi:MAG: hypothetical protein IJ272_02240 [Clostridia bacterium]|nr:hypothetical protein [Clostridia bacterium]